jgi:uncharacterized caspase-like protein
MKKNGKKFVVCIALFFVVAAALGAQQKYALVIGNGAYTSVAKLKNPVNDANDMKAALESIGFTVQVLINANLDQMENAVLNLRKNLTRAPDAYGFFFYAGHGVQSQGDKYLIPIDADIKSENQ